MGSDVNEIKFYRLELREAVSVVIDTIKVEIEQHSKKGTDSKNLERVLLRLTEFRAGLFSPTIDGDCWDDERITNTIKESKLQTYLMVGMRATGDGEKWRDKAFIEQQQWNIEKHLFSDVDREIFKFRNYQMLMRLERDQPQTADPAEDQEAKDEIPPTKPAYQPKQGIIDLINKNKGSFRGWLAVAQLEVDGIVTLKGKDNPLIDYSQGQRIFYDAYEAVFLKHGRVLKNVQDSLKKKTANKVKNRGSFRDVPAN